MEKKHTKNQRNKRNYQFTTDFSPFHTAHIIVDTTSVSNTHSHTHTLTPTQPQSHTRCQSIIIKYNIVIIVMYYYYLWWVRYNNNNINNVLSCSVSLSKLFLKLIIIKHLHWFCTYLLIIGTTNHEWMNGPQTNEWKEILLGCWHMMIIMKLVMTMMMKMMMTTIVVMINVIIMTAREQSSKLLYFRGRHMQECFQVPKFWMSPNSIIVYDPFGIYKSPT